MSEDEKSERSKETAAPAPRKPKIGDTIPAPVVAATAASTSGSSESSPAAKPRSRSRGGRNRSRGGAQKPADSAAAASASDGTAKASDDAATKPAAGGTKGGGNRQAPAKPAGGSKKQGGDGAKREPAAKSDGSDGGSADQGQSPSDGTGTGNRRRRRSRGSGGKGAQPMEPVQALLGDGEAPLELDEATMKRRRGRSRKGRAVGRYQMNVHVTEGGATHVAVLEGRQLIEYYAARPSDDEMQIHGNIYMGRIENVLPGMEAAFVDIGTQKNAVLYRGDVQFDAEDLDSPTQRPRIEEMLKAKQMVICQVTKNPIAHKGARVTQEVSLPGRFVVLVPNSKTYGISKRLSDDERRRLRQILDKARPPQHGVIVRTAAKGVTAEEIERDVSRLVRQWDQIDALAKRQTKAGLLYREPELAARLIREEFNSEYRSVMIDDAKLHQEMHEYVAAISPALAERVQYFDTEAEKLPMFERFHVHEQLHRALDEKVWLPSGGSLVIQHTEALTVIDVNTGKNVGKSSLEETVFRNNLEAAEEIAKQLRLRDIGGIIVIDFVDMEIKDNRDKVLKAFKEALARDKTRSQVYPISDLGLVEMTRKRIGEGLLESFTDVCLACGGRGVLLAGEVLDETKVPPGFQIRRPLP